MTRYLDALWSAATVELAVRKEDVVLLRGEGKSLLMLTEANMRDRGFYPAIGLWLPACHKVLTRLTQNEVMRVAYEFVTFVQCVGVVLGVLRESRHRRPLSEMQEWNHPVCVNFRATLLNVWDSYLLHRGSVDDIRETSRALGMSAGERLVATA
jgi:hypothetical protein